MAEGINVCMFSGNVGRDPELKFSSGGNAVLKFSIAVNERRKKGEQWEDAVEWVPVVLFGKRAEGLGKILEKGTPVSIVGSFRTTSWEKDGQKHYRTEIVADKVALQGGRRGDSGWSRSAPSGWERAAPASTDDGGFADDTDIPF
jgi:single-strand DNA-binding protein